MNHIDRRKLLRGLAATSAMQLTPSLVLAATPTSHTFKLGEFEISVFSDGHLTVPTRFLARNVAKSDIKRWLGQTADVVTPATNVTLVRTPLEIIFIEVGAGPHFMPTAGKLAENMETAGIDPKAVTKVVFTHAHPDHLWGTLDDFDNEPMFPNASFVISAAEWNFWMAMARMPVTISEPGSMVRSLSLMRLRLRFAPGAKFCRPSGRREATSSILAQI
jgi:glyoxylase-like metal-dependent hydrolase (beta-lactamase superfamily II)